MLEPGTILPPLPIHWQGDLTRTTALRGQAALLLFPCTAACTGCRAFFSSLKASEEFAYWSIHPFLVLQEHPADPASNDTIIDTEGRCRALATFDGNEPALAVFDAWQEFRGVLPLTGHAFPAPLEVESWVRSTLRANPG